MQSSQRILPPNPREKVNIFSILTFTWTVPVFKKGYSKILELNDIFRPLNCDRSMTLGDRLEKNWERELTKSKRPSLLLAFIATFWREYGLLSLICACNDLIAQLGQPLLLSHLLLYFRGTGSSVTYQDALLYAFGILVFNGIQTISSNQVYMYGYHNAMKLRVGVCSVIYRKALRLSQTALGDTASGKVVNLLSNDVSRFDLLSLCLNSMWTAPLLSIIVTCLLWREIGPAGLVGVAVILTVVLIQSYTAKLTSKYRAQTALQTDQCIRFMDEIISSIQMIKMYAWEKPFASLISTIRRLELNIIQKTSNLRGVYTVFVLCTTRLAVFSTIVAILTIYGAHEITADKVFVIFAYYHCIAFNFSRMFVRGVAEIAEVHIAIKRLQSFLELPEKEMNANVVNDSEIDGKDFTELTEIPEKNTMPNVTVSMKNASAAWELPCNGNGDSRQGKCNEIDSIDESENKQRSLTLENISVDFARGKLIGVIGSIGAGKSSLLQVLLHELPIKSGSLIINGSTSYASQEPWIFPATVRQNILFGQKYDRDRYNKVVKCCALLKDFEQFANGDQTIVGERGTLSGGQKARINLARACYRNADIYLLDDPLSAVDAHVGIHIYDKCIGPKGYLSELNATRILVTHQVHFLKDADWIIVLNEGKIEFQGPPADVIESGVEFVEFMNLKNVSEDDFQSSNNNRSRKVSTSSSISNSSSNSQCEDIDDKDVDLQMEESSRGKVKGSVVLRYVLAGTNWFVLILLAIAFLIVEICASGSDYWLSIWIKQERTRTSERNHTKDTPETSFDNSLSTEFCMYVQATLIALVFFVSLARSFGFYEMCMRASQNLYESMFNAIVSTKMRFFDVNPSGRILNRFSKDIGTVDEPLPRGLLDALQSVLSLSGSIVITSMLNPYILFPIFVIGTIFIFIRKIYLKTAKNIRRIEGIAKSPAFTHLAATLNGLSTIRAFNAENLLKNEFDHHQDTHSACWFMFCAAAAVFGFALDILCWFFLLCIMSFYMFVDTGAPGEKVGLALTQALSLTGVLQWGIRQSADVVNMMTSVERVLEYCDLEPEKQPKEPQEVSQNWPNEGNIEFRNVFYRYFEDDEPVLRNLSFVIKPKEKIGIVGRTGAGKSSTIGAIFRLACIDGEILIDGVDTSTIRLQDLRKRIAIIPQDPVLFTGTLRRNLDPFEEYPDEEIWHALEKVELKDIVSERGGLLLSVMARGANFSVGQRQLLCLARAILRKNRILLMDEATANVDPMTDLLIQRTIREKFAECTVLTVAHRLHTIMDSDRVMVMDAGQLVEFNEPYKLLQNQLGIFYGMVEALGADEFKQLSTVASKKHQENEK